jgi:hypothetical protein
MNFAIVLSIVGAVLVAVMLPLFLSGKRMQAAEEKSRARRLAEAKMNARLLKFNL